MSKNHAPKKNFLNVIASSEQQNVVRHISKCPRSKHWYDMLEADHVDALYSKDSPLLEAFQACVPVLRSKGLETLADDNLRDFKTMGFSSAHVLQCAGGFLREVAFSDAVVRKMAALDAFETFASKCTRLDNITLGVDITKLYPHEKEEETAERYAALILPLAGQLKHLTVMHWLPEIWCDSVEKCEKLETMEIHMFYGVTPGEDSFWKAIGKTLERLVITGFVDECIEGAVIQTVPKFLRKLNYIGMPTHSPLAHEELLRGIISYGSQLQKAHIHGMTPREAMLVMNACPNVKLGLMFKTRIDARPVMQVAAKRAFRVLIQSRKLEPDCCELLKGCIEVEEMTFTDCLPDHFKVKLPNLRCLDVSTVLQDLRGKLVHFLAENTGGLEILSINGSWALPKDVHTLLQRNKKLEIFSLTVDWTDHQESLCGDKRTANASVSTYLATLVVICSGAPSLNEIHLDVRNDKGHGKLPILTNRCQQFRTKSTMLRVCGVDYCL